MASAECVQPVAGTVWVTRHGDRLDSRDPRWQKKSGCSHDDSPLSDKGRVQAQELAERLKNEKISHIFSSPFQRCVETAHIVAQKLGLSVKLEPGICEVLLHFPPGYQKPVQLKERFSTVDLTYEPTLIPTESESYDDDTFPRCAQTVLPIRSKYAGDILFVAHGASCAGIIKAFTNRPQYIGYCTLSKIEVITGPEKKPTYVHPLQGDSSHLSDKSDLRPW